MMKMKLWGNGDDKITKRYISVSLKAFTRKGERKVKKDHIKCKICLLFSHVSKNYQKNLKNFQVKFEKKDSDDDDEEEIKKMEDERLQDLKERDELSKRLRAKDKVSLVKFSMFRCTSFYSVSF